MGCEALRRCGRDVQELVLERGLEGARNPSALLLQRIRDARDGHGREGRDLRRRAIGAIGAAPAVPAPQAARGMAQEVEEYLARYQVDAMACEALRNCEPRIKEAVVQRGLEGARNPSSALLAKIREFRARG